MEHPSSKLWKTSNGCECTTEEHLLLSIDETLRRSCIDQVCENSIELRECSDTIQLCGRPKLRESSGQRHKNVNVGHENEVSHLCQTNEPVLTWTRCV